jgi:outer membrane lipoprotein LolB
VGFDLRGNVQAGELWLTGPLGSAVAHAQWGPDGAVLIQGQDRRSFTGVDRLWLDLTGIDDLPASVLFAYLQGQASVVPEGWEVNGPRPGRIQLHRMAAAQRPAVRVDILLD